MAKFLVSLFALCGFCTLALAQDPSAGDPISVFSFLRAVWSTVQGMHGAGGLAIIAAVVQLVMLFFRTNLGDGIEGKYKIVIVSLMTLVGAIVAGVLAGQSILEVLASAAVLSALQVFVHQLMQLWGPGSTPAPTITTKKGK